VLPSTNLDWDMMEQGDEFAPDKKLEVSHPKVPISLAGRLLFLLATSRAVSKSLAPLQQRRGRRQHLPLLSYPLLSVVHFWLRSAHGHKLLVSSQMSSDGPLWKRYRLGEDTNSGKQNCTQCRGDQRNPSRSPRSCFTIRSSPCSAGSSLRIPPPVSDHQRFRES